VHSQNLTQRSEGGQQGHYSSNTARRIECRRVNALSLAQAALEAGYLPRFNMRTVAARKLGGDTFIIPGRLQTYSVARSSAKRASPRLFSDRILTRGQCCSEAGREMGERATEVIAGVSRLLDAIISPVALNGFKLRGNIVVGAPFPAASQARIGSRWPAAGLFDLSRLDSGPDNLRCPTTSTTRSGFRFGTAGQLHTRRNRRSAFSMDIRVPAL